MFLLEREINSKDENLILCCYCFHCLEELYSKSLEDYENDDDEDDEYDYEDKVYDCDLECLEYLSIILKNKSNINDKTFLTSFNQLLKEDKFINHLIEFKKDNKIFLDKEKLTNKLKTIFKEIENLKQEYKEEQETIKKNKEIKEENIKKINKFDRISLI